MARLARVIAPGMPHHVTQRGNRRQQTFFGDEDYQHYLELISRFCRAEQVAIWVYCLMPNHVHLILVPQSAESLRRAIGEAHLLAAPGQVGKAVLVAFDGGLEVFVLALPPISAHAEEAAQSAGPARVVLASLSRRRFHGGFHAYLFSLIGGDHSPIARAQQNR